MLWRTQLVCTLLHSPSPLSGHLLRPAASPCLRSTSASRICRSYKARTRHSTSLTDSNRDSPSSPTTFAAAIDEGWRNHVLQNHSHFESRRYETFSIYNSSRQPASWSSSAVDYSRLSRLHCNPLQTAQLRHFSISAATFEKDTSPPPLPLGDAFESSSQAKWAEDAATTAEALANLPPQGDFASLGLGGNTPIGLIQSTLEYLHVHAHLPWWLAIISCTVALRTLMFPLAVKVQANAARLNNIRPEMEKLMEKMRRYNQAGNKTMASQTTTQLLALYQKNKCNPYKMFLMPFVQIPIFVSFFISIRRMAAVPVESMKTGGLFWFTDLTLPDPYYVLPCMACLSFIVTMELGGEAGVTNPQMEKMKTFFRAMSILLIPVTASFPTGLFMYWIPSSLFSMGQIFLLKFPTLRTRLGIPALVKHPEEDKAKKEGEGFVFTVKANYKSALLTSEAKDREARAKKRYEKMKKDKSPKLYDKPPHLR